jgi:uncharacterized protein (TIGR02246 family)
MAHRLGWFGQAHFDKDFRLPASYTPSMLARQRSDTTPDVDWVNIVGTHWEGREAVRRAHAELHKGIFAHSRLLLPDSLELRKIAPDVVIAMKVSRIEVAGPLPNGAPYPSGGNILTFVFVRTSQGWRITHAHNTSIDRDAARNGPPKAQ